MELTSEAFYSHSVQQHQWAMRQILSLIIHISKLTLEREGGQLHGKVPGHGQPALEDV